MEYKLKIGDEETTVNVAIGESKESLIITEDEQETRVKAVPISPNQISLRTEGEDSINAFVAKAEDGLWVWVNGKVRFVQDADRISARRSRGTGDAGGPTEITPQTPSTVVSVMVEAGQHVDKGTPCVVVSAMKMETTLTAPFAGTVEAVNTEEGAKVMPGDILVDIKPDEESEDDNE
jgi:biotin carboxyl carrier protein